MMEKGEKRRKKISFFYPLSDQNGAGRSPNVDQISMNRESLSLEELFPTQMWTNLIQLGKEKKKSSSSSNFLPDDECTELWNTKGFGTCYGRGRREK